MSDDRDQEIDLASSLRANKAAAEDRAERADREAAAAAAASVDPARAAAAERLGLRSEEIAAVKERRPGVVITTTDGVEYIDVAEHRPDAEGKSGLMLLDPPPGYRGTFPVYAKQAVPQDQSSSEPDSPPLERPAAGDDLLLEVLEQQLLEAEQWVAAIERGERHESELVMAREQHAQLEALVKRRRLALEAAGPEPEPDAEEVAFMRAVVRWAAAVLAAAGDDWATRQADTEHKAANARLLLFNPAMAEHELSSATRWLEHRGLTADPGGHEEAGATVDPVGQEPLTQPRKQRRRRRGRRAT